MNDCITNVNLNFLMLQKKFLWVQISISLIWISIKRFIFIENFKIIIKKLYNNELKVI